MKITQKDKETAEELLSRLTLDEKIAMIHGTGLFHTGEVSRLGIPSLRMSDGPMGVRMEMKDDAWEAAGNTEDYVTYLPCNSAIASTWNRELAYACGQVLGEEARGRGKDVILAPGINIKRSPLCGRNFEYMSEDPYLTAQQCVPLIQGVQEQDVAACVKHYALNHQEFRRLWVNAQVDERALREIYLPAFYAAAKEGEALSMMGAYNLVRGSRCCENVYLLDEILRKEWNWEGVMISDWGGILRTKESVMVSMDIEMSIFSNFEDYFFARPLKEAVESGEIPEEVIDQKVRRILAMMSALHMLDGKRRSGCYNTMPHRETTLRAAREAVILLKNEDHRLPLSKEKMKKLLVIGQNADRLYSCGGGSAEIKALYEISPLAGLKAVLGGNTQVDFIKGYYVPEQKKQSAGWQENSLNGGAAEGKKDARTGSVAAQEVLTEEVCRNRELLLREAEKMAEEYDEVLFIGGLDHSYDVEDQDRRDMKLPYGQEEVIEAVLRANPNTVIVMLAGSPVEMGSFLHKAKAIIWQWYAGMEGGTALAEVLLGITNPSGKLPETFPLKHEDCSAHCIGEFGKETDVYYKEGIYVGYRYYDTNRIPVAFPFGHGLSYTEFAYRDMKIWKEETASSLKIRVSCIVKNTGDRDGKEIIQLYVSAKESAVDRPAKELKGYEKLSLKAGEEQEAVFYLDEQTFRYFDETRQCFYTESGTYEILLGASVEDIRLMDYVKLDYDRKSR